MWHFYLISLLAFSNLLWAIFCGNTLRVCATYCSHFTRTIGCLLRFSQRFFKKKLLQHCSKGSGTKSWVKQLTWFVSTHVTIKSWFDCEGPMTSLALEWFLACVNTDVTLKIARFPEALMAMATLVSMLTWHNVLLFLWWPESLYTTFYLKEHFMQQRLRKIAV